LQRTVSDGDEVEWYPLFEEMPFQPSTITIDLSAPYELERPYAAATMRRIDGGMGHMPSSGPPLQPLVPSLGYASFDVTVNGGNDTGGGEWFARGLHPGDTMRAELPPLPTGIEPQDGVSGVDLDTVFSWNGSPGAVYLLTATAVDLVQIPAQVRIVSANPTARLPDLSRLGVTWPAQQQYRWLARSLYGPGSVDAHASGARAVSSLARSAPRHFTTRP